MCVCVLLVVCLLLVSVQSCRIPSKASFCFPQRRSHFFFSCWLIISRHCRVPRLSLSGNRSVFPQLVSAVPFWAASILMCKALHVLCCCNTVVAWFILRLKTRSRGFFSGWRVVSLTFDALLIKRAVNKRGCSILEFCCVSKRMRAKHSVTKAAVYCPCSFLASLYQRSGKFARFYALNERESCRVLRTAEVVRQSLWHSHLHEGSSSTKRYCVVDSRSPCLEFSPSPFFRPA